MPLTIPLTAGTKLYKYELSRHIGGGGFGDVWLARDHSIAKDVAVKVLDDPSITIDERLKEAQIGNRLDHANLVKVHYADVVQHSGTPLVLIAMDFHAGGALAGRLNAGNFLPLPETIRFIIDVLRGLEYLHENDLYHGDIKPKNILVGEANEGILTDYGISCHSPSLMPVAHRGAYKLHIAPEVISTKKISVQTDIYQVGMTAFRLLNGIGTIQDKFNRLGESAFNDLVQRGRVIGSDDYQFFVPRFLKTIINKAINIDPASRYQSALEMRRALEAQRYPGFWGCNATGELIGYSEGYEYHFRYLPRASGLFEFLAFKKNLASGRETKVTKYCRNKLTRAQSDNLKKNFIQSVVTGTS